MCAAALGGCATQEYQGADYGTVVVSMARDGRSLDVALLLRPRGGREMTEVTVDDNAAGAFSEDAAMGIVRAIRLKPGAYEIHAFASGVSRLNLAYATPASFQPIPFLVETGKVTYAGRYLASLRVAQPEQMKTGETISVIPFTAMNFVIEPVDEHVRDLGTAAASDPLLASRALRLEVPLARGRIDFPLN